MDSIEVANSINPDLLHPIADPRVGSIPWWSLRERDVAKEVTRVEAMSLAKGYCTSVVLTLIPIWSGLVSDDLEYQ